MVNLQVLKCDTCGHLYGVDYDGLTCDQAYCAGLLIPVLITPKELEQHFKEKAEEEADDG